jgi:hypothetical protein
MTKEQKDIGGQIIAAEQFLLHSFILFDRERPWQALGATRSVFAMQQRGEFGKPLACREVISILVWNPSMIPLLLVNLHMAAI